MRVQEIQVYTFDELSEDAKLRAISDHIEFEIEDANVRNWEHVPYSCCADKMERLQTPWFLGQCIYDDHKEQIIDTIKANEYEFLANGKLA